MESVHNLDLTCPRRFSSFIAAAMLPLILSLPPMKAMVGLRVPLNMDTRSSESILIKTSASMSDWPGMMEPEPFFRSMNHEPAWQSRRIWSVFIELDPSLPLLYLSVRKLSGVIPVTTLILYSASLKTFKDLPLECQAYYRRCCNEIHKVIIPQTVDSIGKWPQCVDAVCL